MSGGSSAGLVAVFGPRGNVSALISTAHGYDAGGIAPGMGAARLPRSDRALSGGRIRLGRKLRGGARFIYGTRGGKVRFVGVVSRTDAANPKILRGDLTAAGV